MKFKVNDILNMNTYAVEDSSSILELLYIPHIWLRLTVMGKHLQHLYKKNGERAMNRWNSALTGAVVTH
jgi:hypothetical protein